jgi:tetratricopeptide (TPR) repeat protein
MVKINRNAPCSCGSGKKYKRCCLPRDQEAAAQRRDQVAPQESPSLQPTVLFDDDDNLEQLSNSVLDLIDEGRIDEAEEACRQLKRDFPDVIDWIERTGAVHEARGETDKAVEYYRRCLQYIDDHPDYFDEASKDWYRRSIKRLESSDESTGASEPPSA